MGSCNGVEPLLVALSLSGTATRICWENPNRCIIRQKLQFSQTVIKKVRAMVLRLFLLLRCMYYTRRNLQNGDHLQCGLVIPNMAMDLACHFAHFQLQKSPMDVACKL